MRQRPSYKRIFQLTGPADIVSNYQAWRSPRAGASSFGGGVHLEQFFQLCDSMGSDVKLVSTAPGKNATFGRFDLEYRDLKTKGLSGFRYHLRMLRFMTGILMAIVRFKPDLVLMTIGEPYWFIFYALYFSRIEFVPSFHCTLWPRLRSFDELSFPQRLLLKLTGSFIRFRCTSMMSITEASGPQLARMTGSSNLRIVPFRPIYDPKLFAHIAPADWKSRPFRILFAGNIMRQKGVFTLLDIAERLSKRHGDQIVFDVCGEGPDLPALSNLVKERNLSNVLLHGYCNRDELSAFYGKVHAVIVPTTRDFPEGFNRVSIEAVLSRRPIIVSKAVVEPVLSGVAIELDPTDVEGFADAIARLYSDEVAYEALRKRIQETRAIFLDPAHGWGHGLRTILEHQVDHREDAEAQAAQ